MVSTRLSVRRSANDTNAFLNLRQVGDTLRCIALCLSIPERLRLECTCVLLADLVRNDALLWRELVDWGSPTDASRLTDAALASLLRRINVLHTRVVSLHNCNRLDGSGLLPLMVCMHDPFQCAGHRHFCRIVPWLSRRLTFGRDLSTRIVVDLFAFIHLRLDTASQPSSIRPRSPVCSKLFSR